jgi:hypothetical protein
MSPVNAIPRFIWALKPREPWQVAAGWIACRQGFACWRETGKLRMTFASRGSALRWELGENVEPLLRHLEREHDIILRAWPPPYPSLADWLLAEPGA